MYVSCWYVPNRRVDAGFAHLDSCCRALAQPLGKVYAGGPTQHT